MATVIDTLETGTYATLSTAHLSESDRNYLLEQAHTSELTDEFAVYEKETYGFFIYITTRKPITDTDIPYNIRNALNYCQQKGATLVVFDCDGYVVKDLPVTEPIMGD